MADPPPPPPPPPPPTKRLEEKTFLAPSFVPEHWRSINYHKNVTVFAATTQLDSNFPSPHLPGAIALVPPVPRCICPNGPHVFPNRISDPNELYMALEADAPSTNTKNGNSFKAQNGVKSSTTTIDLETCSSLEHYKITWERFLHKERRELLLRSEQKSQYATPVDCHHAHSILLQVPGIADANPPVLVGDTVLLRPIPRSRLPLINGGWSGPVHAIEVRTRVLAVHRGGAKKGRTTADAVAVSWFANDRVFVQGFGGVRKLQMNIRFVPASTSYTRCLTALDWLEQTYRTAAEQADIFRVLFPEESPVIPPLPTSAMQVFDSRVLNHKQNDFVRMVLTHTHSPSTSQVRSPMVLTGPAGTGT